MEIWGTSFILAFIIVICCSCYSCGLYNKEHVQKMQIQHEQDRHEEVMARVKANDSKVDRFLKWVVK